MASAFRIIRNGRLVDLRHCKTAPADILIEGDTILTIGAPGMDAPSHAVVVDASERAMMPGLVNSHVHGHGTLAKGLVGDRWPLELFLNAMPGMTGNRTLEDKYLNGLVAAVEMIHKGCTACYDLFFEFPLPSREGVIALGSAYRDAGVRAVIAPMVADKTLPPRQCAPDRDRRRGPIGRRRCGVGAMRPPALRHATARRGRACARNRPADSPS